MNFNLKYIFFIIFFINNNLYCQYKDGYKSPYNLKSYSISFYSDTKVILLNSLDYNKSKLIKASAFGIGGVLLYSYDSNIKNYCKENQNKNINSIASQIKGFGEGEYSMPLLGGMYLYGQLSGHYRMSTVALNGFKAYAISGVLVRFPKLFFSRTRPYSGNFNEWEGPLYSIRNGIFHNKQSFPSGHTISAFSVASLIAHSYPDKRWVQITAWTLATGVALSRVYQNQHWSTDVYTSIIWGYSIGKLISLNNKKEKLNNTKVF